MSGLRLGTHGLRPVEVARVRALMRKLDRLDDFSWRFSERGPFDALVVDGKAPDRDPRRPATRAVVRLVGPGAGDAAQGLPWPLQADRLAACLHRLEQEFTRANVPVLESPLPMIGRDGEVTAPVLHPLPPGRYRLRRWPPLAVLRDDPRRIRMATLLSRRSLTLAELANLSAQPGDACLRFVRSLEARGFIEVLDAMGLPVRSRRRWAPAFARAMINGIRRRLGWSTATS